jgi:hypothetical protein
VVVRSNAYGELLERVTELLARHDPIGLIELGMPMDEYEPEVGTIVPRLRSASSPDDVRRIVHEEFERWIDSDTGGPPSHYDAVGDELWALWLDSPVRGSTSA